jgi:hypothetical protein
VVMILKGEDTQEAQQLCKMTATMTTMRMMKKNKATRTKTQMMRTTLP